MARCADEGLARMRVESIDVVMTLGPDARTPIAQTLAAFADLVDRGHARYWGLSIVDADGLTA